MGAIHHTTMKLSLTAPAVLGQHETGHTDTNTSEDTAQSLASCVSSLLIESALKQRCKSLDVRRIDTM